MKHSSRGILCNLRETAKQSIESLSLWYLVDNTFTIDENLQEISEKCYWVNQIFGKCLFWNFICGKVTNLPSDLGSYS